MKQLENAPKDGSVTSLLVDGKTIDYKYINDKWEGTSNSNLNIVLDRTQIEQDLQNQLDKEKENSTKLKTITEGLLQEKIKRGEMKQSDIPEFLQGRAEKNAGADSKRGGGVTKLNDYGKSPQDMVYDTMSEGISDLFARVRKGDVEAKKKLDELKELAIGDLKIRSARNEPFYMVQCVSCGQMVDVQQHSTCPNCSEKLGVSG
jgi:hypothetical protein